MRILFAEDEVLPRQAMTLLLQSLGYEVVAVGCGQAALDALAADGVGLVILDLMMLPKSGLQFLREATKAGTLHCPVIVLTGYDPAWVAGVAGVTAVLSKPVADDELQRAIEMVVGGG